MEYTGHPPIERQRIINDTGARDQPDRAPLACRARLVWEHDGVEHLETVATRWDPRSGDVYVLVPDGRCVFTGAWLSLAHVTFDPPR